MFDPFAAALDALFNGPGSAAAVYFPTMGPPVPVRVIRSQPDQVSRFGEASIIQATNLFDIRRSDVERPENGAILVVGGSLTDGVVDGGEAFTLHGGAKLDLEGMTWMIGAEPA